MQSREEKLLKNSIIYSIGNIGSKVLSYVMVLVYTHYIASSALGYYDIVFTTIGLLMPIVLLGFDEGIYRWIIESDEKAIVQTISTCIKIVLGTSCITIILFFLANYAIHFSYAIEIAVLFFSEMMLQLSKNAVRGMSKSKLYAVCGLINSFLLLLMEIVGIVALGLGIQALFLARIIANVFTIFLIFCQQKEFRNFYKYRINYRLATEILCYTAPLIPNTISWWLVNFSDRYIILGFVGNGGNGIYTIANKFPTVISVIASILYLSFQETIIKEYQSNDRNEFYTKLFNQYFKFMFSLAICGMPLTKLVIILFCGAEYSSAWKYVGFLFLGAVFSALSSFLGIGYQISKDTKRSALSTVFAAMANVGINIGLIRFIGLHSASLSTFLAYMFLFFVRVRHTKKYFSIKYNWKMILGMFLIALICLALMYYGDITVNIAIFIVSIIFLYFNNKNIIYKLTKRLHMRK